MMYELVNVKLLYGQRVALSIPAMLIGKGERVALMGPNGSGKTSLLKLMDGLIGPSEGRVLLEGKTVVKPAPARPRSVYLHQYPYLLSGTVAYNVGFGCRALGMDAREIRRRAEEAIALLGLEGMEGRTNRALSGGEAQRVKLATELSRRATGKTLYILDEPTTGLHFADIERLLFILKRLVLSGNTVIIIEHNMDVIKNCDWIIDLGPEGGDSGGKLIAQGTPNQISKVKTSYTGQFLAKNL